MYNNIQNTAAFLREQGISEVQYGIILGTGLGGLITVVDVIKEIDYQEIPHFPTSTVKGHSGKLIYGKIGDKTVLAMQGRFHYYEGYPMAQVTFPVRVMSAMGINRLIVSNACGGVNPAFKVGDIMLIRDHINMMPEHPLRGQNDERLGPRFVDMHEPYNLDFIAAAEQIAQSKNIKVQKGIYLALQGPTFETPAEYSMVSRLGADAVGMSTVPEVIVAKHMGMTCFGVSVITDLGIEGIVEEVSHEAVQVAAKIAEKHVQTLVCELIKSLD